MGEPGSVSMGVTQDLFLTIPRGSFDSLTSSIDLSTDLIAPLEMNSPVGVIRVTLEGENVSEVPLVTLHEVPEAGLWTRLKDQVMLWAQ